MKTPIYIMIIPLIISLTIHPPTATAASVSGTNVCAQSAIVLLDVSTSMRPRKDDIVSFAGEYVKNETPKTCIVLATFGDGHEKNIQWFDASSRQKVAQVIADMPFSDRDTRFDIAMQLADGIVRNTRSRVLKLLVITDALDGRDMPAADELVGNASLLFKSDIPVAFIGADDMEPGSSVSRYVFLPLSSLSAEFAAREMNNQQYDSAANKQRKSRNPSQAVRQRGTKKSERRGVSVYFKHIRRYAIPATEILIILLCAMAATRHFKNQRIAGYRVRARAVLNDQPFASETKMLTESVGPLTIGGLGSDMLDAMEFAVCEITLNGGLRLVPYTTARLDGRDIRESDNPLLKSVNTVDFPDIGLLLTLEIETLRGRE